MKRMRGVVLTLSIVVIAVAMAMLATACSGGDSKPTPSPTPTAATAATPASTNTPVFGTPIALPPTPLVPERGAADLSEGIGVYPAVVAFADALRGGEYFRTVGIQNGGPIEHTYSFETSGDTAPWLTFVSPDRATDVNEVVVPPHGSIQVLVKAVVPPSAANGAYDGSIRVLTTTSVGPDSENSGTGVRLGADVSVSVAVTGTQRIDGQFVDAGASDVESGYPLRIQSSLVNSGNVQVNAIIDVNIVDSAGNVVDHLTSTDQVLYPNERKQLITEWDTTGKTIGERTASISIKYGDLDLGTKDVRFNILPVGTFTRRAELADVHLANSPRAGELAKLVAVFTNTGQIETRGKFVGELYSGERLIAPLTSEEQLLLPGGTGDLEILTTVPEDGDYTVRGRINYEGRETDEQSFSFKVGSSGGGVSPLLIAAGLVAVFVVLAGGGWALVRRRARVAG
ncbi:MAG: hypothetical protein HY873_06375 [Chloroflexi bacterium]|nr:hypothetical protein [Chloroflexota bacterium]